MMNLIFSIITPVYNRADCISRCMDSVCKQSFSNWEFLIVDDGSTDHTMDIIDSYVERDNRIKFIKFPVNRGTNAARNAAIALAKGQYSILLDSDDYLVSDALEKIYRAIVLNSGFQHYLFAVSDRINDYSRNDLLKSDHSILLFKNWLTREVNGDFAHVISTNILKKFPFNEKYRIYEELTFYKLLKESGKQMFINELILVRERGRKDSVTNEANLYNISAILFSKEVNELIINIHYQDFMEFKAEKYLLIRLKNLFLYSIMLGLYNDIPAIRLKIHTLGEKVPFTYELLYKVKMGWLFFLLVRCYSYLKNQILFKQK